MKRSKNERTFELLLKSCRKLIKEAENEDGKREKEKEERRRPHNLDPMINQ